jgi:hypothetical protein
MRAENEIPYEPLSQYAEGASAAESFVPVRAEDTVTS